MIIVERCCWCDKQYVNGEPDCSHLDTEITPEISAAGNILMAIQFCDHFCCGLPAKLCQAKQLAEAIKTLVRNEREECYQDARGSNDPQAFEKYGNRQLYWKGRSDAATAIRARNAV